MTYATVLQALRASNTIDDKRKVFNSDVDVRAEYRSHIGETVRKMNTEMLASFETWLAGKSTPKKVPTSTKSKAPKVTQSVTQSVTVSPIPEGLSDEVMALLSIIDNPGLTTNYAISNSKLLVLVETFKSVTFTETDDDGQKSGYRTSTEQSWLSDIRSAVIEYGLYIKSRSIDISPVEYAPVNYIQAVSDTLDYEAIAHQKALDNGWIWGTPIETPIVSPKTPKSFPKSFKVSRKGFLLTFVLACPIACIRPDFFEYIEPAIIPVTTPTKTPAERTQVDETTVLSSPVIQPVTTLDTSIVITMDQFKTSVGYLCKSATVIRRNIGRYLVEDKRNQAEEKCLKYFSVSVDKFCEILSSNIVPKIWCDIYIANYKK